MYQFDTEDHAIQAARVLAVRRSVAIKVLRSSTRVWTISPITNPSPVASGRHVATVYDSGLVDRKNAIPADSAVSLR